MTGKEPPFESFPELTEKCVPLNSALVSVTTAPHEEQIFSLRSLRMIFSQRIS
jgi:hypothetical protein